MVTRSRVAVVALVAAVVVLMGCNPKPEGVESGPVHYGVLTSGGETYVYGGDNDTVTMAAPSTNTEGNIRQVFWKDDARWWADQQAWGLPRLWLTVGVWGGQAACVAA